MPHVGGLHTPAGGYDPEVRTRLKFWGNAPTIQVSSSYVYLFGSYRIDKHTDKQTPLKTSNILRYATTLGYYSVLMTLTEA